ncbi:D-2-hydroxyacid dehydrogenase [Devosia nitrariae]|uniref:2-hydroxyacid dehydrogenase n=1 Tax=Devosia nitrariae TaxID=2071872 RepID=A0ABQ5W5H4_9HYPH|nr:D-2-hydroxyacid dehydrogenase [Devosia nitrariae]GLQ55185.1 2-hydroxyacid dehydrogenase [Devosia nitrariae]
MSNEKLTILVSSDVDATRQAELRSIAPGADIVVAATPADITTHADEADIIAGFVPPETLRKARLLKWVHSWAAGPDTQLYREFISHPAVLTSSAGNGAVPLAEHAMMLMLMLNRNALRWVDNQRARKWERFTHGELNGLTVGILGAGHSGSDLALKAKAFHMRVLGLRRSDRPAANFDRFYPREELHDFLAEADFVVVTAPLTPETRGMLDEAAFRAMKPSAYFICFSRGGIADDDALLRALGEGWIAGAGIDAHGIEPLPPDSPFWDAPNTIVTPHNGATSRQTRQRGYDIFADNLRRYLAGEPLVNVVDKAAGY